MTTSLVFGMQIQQERLAEFCQRHQISKLALFGSAVGDGFRSESDIDVLVSFQPGAKIGFIRFSRMQRELSTLLGRQVDLVTEAGLKPLIRDEILSGSQELYAA